MPIQAETKTDLRVHQVVSLFNAVAGWKILHEIDSANYGEGYDLDYNGVPVRLHDDERSDAVMAHPAFVPGKNWEAIFVEVEKSCAGKIALQFEIDGFDRKSSDDQERAFHSIVEVLGEHGLETKRSEDTDD